MAKRVLVAFLVMVSVALVGCKPSSSIVGTWDVQGSGFPHEVTYTADGKMTGSMDAMGMKIAYEGTYKLENTTMTSTGTSYSVNGKPAPAQVKAALDPLILTTSTVNLKWKDNDEFSLQLQGQELTLKRKPTGAN